MSDDDDEVVVVGGLCREVFSNLIIQSGHENVDVVLFERKDKKRNSSWWRILQVDGPPVERTRKCQKCCFFFFLVFFK